MTQPCNTGRENLVSAEQSTYYKLFMSKKKTSGPDNFNSVTMSKEGEFR